MEWKSLCVKLCFGRVVVRHQSVQLDIGDDNYDRREHIFLYIYNGKEMILYENSIENFLASSKTRSLADYIVDEYSRRASRKLSPVRKNSWKYIMEILRRLIEDAGVNSECGIRIDYVMLEKHNRFEILIGGVNDKG